jgi:hypothetical protein
LKTGICAIAHNAILLDFHFQEFIKWHCPLVDTVLLNINKLSEDNTWNIARRLQKDYPNLELIETDWGDQSRKAWLGDAKYTAWKSLDTELKILLDIDEFFNDKSIGDMKSLDPNFIYAGEYIHFVGSWKTIGQNNFWPNAQWRVGFRTIDNIYNSIKVDDSGSNIIGVPPIELPVFRIYHFGAVRQRKVLIDKWEDQTVRDLDRHSIATEDWLTCAEGKVDTITKIEDSKVSHIQDFFKTSEFERDNFSIYNQQVNKG